MTRWKKLSLVLLLCICLFSSGCSPPAPEPEPESQPESSSAVSETSSQEEEPVSSQREYLPENEDGISALDFETIYALCSDALMEYQSALANNTGMDFSPYIENPDLISYMEKQLDLERLYHGFYTIKEYERLGLAEYDLQKRNKDRVYLKIGPENNSIIEFLVENTGERLVITEWYGKIKDSIDLNCRGYLDIRKDNLYWDDYDPEALQKAIEEEEMKYPDPVK